MDPRPRGAFGGQTSDPLLEKLADYQARLVSADLVTAQGTVYEPLPAALRDMPATIVNDITVDTVHFVTYFALGDPSAPQLRWEAGPQRRGSHGSLAHRSRRRSH